MRAAALMLAAGLLLPGPVQAARPITPPAPDFLADAAWLNAKPLTLTRLRRRRVVLAAFLSTVNINSIRALAALNTWHERYEMNGLLVVGVHTPEYDFQKDPLLVRAAVQRFAVRFPVMLDNDRKYWRAHNNEGWPAFYLIDHKGRVVFDHLGEGGYAEFEDEIRAALKQAGFAVPAVAENVKDPPAADCGGMTPEVNLGVRRGRTFNLGNTPPQRIFVGSARDGETAYSGQWDEEPDALRLAQKNAKLSAFLRLIYHGAQVFAVLAPPQGRSIFYVRQDEMWLHSGNAGKDIQFDDDGRSFVAATETRLYNLAQNPNDAMHEFMLIPTDHGSAVYGFSFSDRCLPAELP